jgi:hypothetical protein
MFCELGEALRYSRELGWHMFVKGGYVEVDIVDAKKIKFLT